MIQAVFCLHGLNKETAEDRLYNITEIVYQIDEICIKFVRSNFISKCIGSDEMTLHHNLLFIYFMRYAKNEQFGNASGLILGISY
jgi:hypothetical protein